MEMTPVGLQDVPITHLIFTEGSSHSVPQRAKGPLDFCIASLHFLRMVVLIAVSVGTLPSLIRQNIAIVNLTAPVIFALK